MHFLAGQNDTFVLLIPIIVELCCCFLISINTFKRFMFRYIVHVSVHIYVLSFRKVVGYDCINSDHCLSISLSDKKWYKVCFLQYLIRY